MTDARLLRRLWRYVAPHWPTLVLAFVLMAASAGLDVIVPYALKVAIDAHIAVHRADGLLLLVVVIGGGIILRAVVRAGISYALAVLGQRIANDVRTALHTHLLGRSAAFFDRTQVGGLIATINNDVEGVNQMFTTGIVSFAADAVTLVAIVVTMLYLSVELTLVTLVMLPVLIAVSAWSRRLMRTSFRELSEQRSALSSYLIERLNGIKTVQAFCRERRAVDECAAISDRYRVAANSSLRATAVVMPVTDAAALVVAALLLMYIGVGREVASAGLAVAFIEYSNRVYAPLAQLSQKGVAMQAGLAGFERVLALLDSGEPDAPPRTAPAPAASEAPARADEHHVIEFRDVEFSYRTDAPVLRGINLAVAGGTTLAVVGATGAGKSTLARLLARHYEPRAGEVLVRGRDVRDWPIKELRSRLTIIPQDVFLFSGTLAENVRVGRTSASADEVERALVQVGAGRLLERLGGIEAEIAERGANLSGGERQLVSFARALIRDPDILILDEATANVDPETEQVIEQAMSRLFAGRTTLIIAHRLATIRRADRIAVIDGGTIVEHGTRDELLAVGGLYARLEARLAPDVTSSLRRAREDLDVPGE